MVVTFDLPQKAVDTLMAGYACTDEELGAQLRVALINIACEQDLKKRQKAAQDAATAALTAELTRVKAEYEVLK